MKRGCGREGERKDRYWREEKEVEKGGGIEEGKRRGRRAEGREGKRGEGSVLELLRAVLAAGQPWPAAHWKQELGFYMIPSSLAPLHFQESVAGLITRRLKRA